MTLTLEPTQKAWREVAERMREALRSAENAFNAISPMVTIAGLGDLTEKQMETFRTRSAAFSVARQTVKEAITLRAVAPPEGNSDSAAADQLCIVEADLDRLRKAANEACDLLAERIHGSPARSPGHNARLRLESALKTVPAPPERAADLETLVREYARDLRRNASGGDDYPWSFAKGAADYLETLIERSKTGAGQTSTDAAAAPPEQSGPIEFPYTRTFQAIAAATSLYAGGVGISVSVEKFQDAFNNYAGAPAARSGRPNERQTPAARWREAGEPDPHGVRYDCDRAQLAGGDMTDDEVANAVFLNSSIHNLTIAKDRIRWLSRRLEQAERQAREKPGDAA